MVQQLLGCDSENCGYFAGNGTTIECVFSQHRSSSSLRHLALSLLPSRPFAHAANTRKKYRKFMILFLNLFF
jgi:hypothetical protein